MKHIAPELHNAAKGGIFDANNPRRYSNVICTLLNRCGVILSKAYFAARRTYALEGVEVKT